MRPLPAASPAPRPVRVLWFIKSLGHGGAERLLDLMVRHVDRRRFDVEVAYVSRGIGELRPLLESRGVRVHCLDAAGNLDVSWLPRLRSLLRRGRFDIIHSHSPLTAALARMAVGGARPVHVYTEHNIWPAYRPATRALNAVTYRRNAAVVAVSRGVAESIDQGARRAFVRCPPVVVVHHGFDQEAVVRGTAARATARGRLGFSADDVLVGTVGAFRPEKNQRLLVESFSRIAPRDPRLRLLLVGYGGLQEPLRAQAERAGLADRVTFTGRRDDVQELLPALDVFALSSLQEGLPLSLLEAMATGIPCVATAVGGVPEVLTDGREGFLVPPGDARGLAAAIQRLVDDEDLRGRMGAAAAGTARGFSVGSAVDRVQRLYTTVLGADEAAREAHGP